MMKDRLISVYYRINSLSSVRFPLRTYSNSAKKKWKIMFFGTDNFAVESLQQLHKTMESGEVIEKLSVVVPPPKHQICPAERYARQKNIPYSYWPLPKEFPSNENYDVGVVASFGYLIPQRIIKVFPKGVLNIHGSLLPKWRGAAPIMHAIMNGDQETGVSIMRIKPFHFDVGEIVLQEQMEIDPHITSVELTDQLAQLGSKLLVKTFSDLDYYLNKAEPQSEEGVTLAPKIDDRLAAVDWNSLSALQVYNRWRALHHLFKLRTSFHGENVKLDGMQPPIERLSDHAARKNNLCPDLVVPGRVVVDRRQNLMLIRCRENWAPFRDITVNKKATMSALDFANGYLHKRPPDQHLFLS